jgi:hypothetical protein
MADTLGTTPRLLLVDGRNPTADEAITVSDPTLLTVAAQADGTTLVTALTAGTCTITVAPGAADIDRTAGSDDVTVTSSPLVVSLG